MCCSPKNTNYFAPFLLCYLALQLESIILANSQAEVMLPGNFNVYHKEWIFPCILILRLQWPTPSLSETIWNILVGLQHVFLVTFLLVFILFPSNDEISNNFWTVDIHSRLPKKDIIFFGPVFCRQVTPFGVIY